MNNRSRNFVLVLVRSMWSMGIPRGIQSFIQGSPLPLPSLTELLVRLVQSNNITTAPPLIFVSTRRRKACFTHTLFFSNAVHIEHMHLRSALSLPVAFNATPWTFFLPGCLHLTSCRPVGNAACCFMVEVPATKGQTVITHVNL